MTATAWQAQGRAQVSQSAPLPVSALHALPGVHQLRPQGLCVAQGCCSPLSLPASVRSVSLHGVHKQDFSPVLPFAAASPKEPSSLTPRSPISQ